MNNPFNLYYKIIDFIKVTYKRTEFLKLNLSVVYHMSEFLKRNFENEYKRCAYYN